MHLKIKIPNGILVVELLTVALFIVVYFTPVDSLRVILGVPFLLLFPGYTLATVLFPYKEGMRMIERWTISVGMSIVLVALIGLGLNYTPQGVSLDSVLLAAAAFIMVMSVVAIVRNRSARLMTEYRLSLPGRQEALFGRLLTLVFIITLTSAAGVLVYTMAVPRIGESFTEFYLLGLDRKAEIYPTEFTMQNGQVTGVTYSDREPAVTGTEGKVTLGVVNQEQKTAAYFITVLIDGEPVNIKYAGQSLAKIGPLVLQQDEKWEQEISFAPTHSGDNQKVEFQLYRDDGSSPVHTLTLWIGVKEGT